MKICTEADYLQAHLTVIEGESRRRDPAFYYFKQWVTSILKKWIGATNADLTLGDGRAPRGKSLSAVALGRRLNQVDEVAAGVLEQDGGDGPHTRWYTTEFNTKRLEAPELSVDVARQESRGRNASGKQGLLIRLSWRETHRFQY